MLFKEIMAVYSENNRKYSAYKKQLLTVNNRRYSILTTGLERVKSVMYVVGAGLTCKGISCEAMLYHGTSINTSSRSWLSTPDPSTHSIIYPFC
jgi:hypothetical protein